MFKLEVDPIFTADVSIPVPGKAPEIVPFEFRHRERDAFDALIAAWQSGERTLDDIVREIVAGWKVPNLPFNDDALTRCFQVYPGSAHFIFGGFRKGLLEGGQKN